MKTKTRQSFLLSFLLVFSGIPLLLLFYGNFPERTPLKTALSAVTILAFWFMLGQMYLAQPNSYAVKAMNLGKLIKLHKFIGYTCCLVVLFHPFYLVVPRFFEGGSSPYDSLLIILTSFSSNGVVLGMLAWGLMLFLGFTSLIRKWLPLSYTGWKKLHGIVSALFTGLACWHVIEIGRHSTPLTSTVLILLTGGGLLLLIKYYFTTPSPKASAEKLSKP